MGTSSSSPLKGDFWNPTRRLLRAPDISAAEITASVLSTLRERTEDFLASESCAPSLVLGLRAAASLAEQDETHLAEFAPDVERNSFLLFVSNVIGAAKDRTSAEGQNSIFSDIAVNSLSRSLVDLVAKSDEDLSLTVSDAARRLAQQERTDVLRSFVTAFLTGLLSESVRHFIGREWQKVAGSFAVPTPLDRADIEAAVPELCRQAVDSSGIVASFEDLIRLPDIRDASERVGGTLREAVPVAVEQIKRLAR